MMVQAYIGVGSNQGSSEKLIEEAWTCVKNLPQTQSHTKASLWSTKPWGVTDQDDFLNTVFAFQTEILAEELLKSLLSIEEAMGRDRTRETPWGPRVMDLDLLAYGEQVIQSECLTVPHPLLQERAFVLDPWFELAPEWKHPILGQTVGDMRDALTRSSFVC